jgi:hypothetical protein
MTSSGQFAFTTAVEILHLCICTRWSTYTMLSFYHDPQNDYLPSTSTSSLSLLVSLNDQRLGGIDQHTCVTQEHYFTWCVGIVSLGVVIKSHWYCMESNGWAASRVVVCVNGCISYHYQSPPTVAAEHDLSTYSSTVVLYCITYWNSKEVM